MYGDTIYAGLSVSMDLPNLDFETYSEAGYVWSEERQKWVAPRGCPPNKKGIKAVGSAAYCSHPTAEVLCLFYDLKDGRGRRFWTPGMPNPTDLIQHYTSGALIEGHNVEFEFDVIHYICVPKYGWPEIPVEALRCSMAKAAAFGLPRALADVCGALGLPADVAKQKHGSQLIAKYCVPKNPTKRDPRRRRYLTDDLADAAAMYRYNEGDIIAEDAVSLRCPELDDFELAVWHMNVRVNRRGVAADVEALNALINVLESAIAKYEPMLTNITRGHVNKVTELPKMKEFAQSRGVAVDSLDADAMESLLATGNPHNLPPDVLDMLKLRDKMGGSSVKKVYAIERQLCADGRLHGLFAYAGAGRTKRFAGRGPQPQNLASTGPKIVRCDPFGGCGHHYDPRHLGCPWCGTPSEFNEQVDWNVDAVDNAIKCALAGLESVEYVFGDPFEIVKSCLRGLFVAAPGHDLICSDYSAIEAVVLAVLAGEEWRLEVFRTHGKIYEMSAAAVSGVSFEEMMAHAGYLDLTVPYWWEQKRTGEHHPLRKKLGKVAELASGYQGSVSAWRNFGADEYFDTDEEILAAVRAWRKSNPNIVQLWYALEECAKDAIRDPGAWKSYRDIAYLHHNGSLYCRLPSGGYLTYHCAKLQTVVKFGKPREVITFWGYNSDSSKGKKGWVLLETYGGKLVENVTQATARDIICYTMLNAESRGYPIVLHVHDEAVAEVKQGFGSVEEFEAILNTLPPWAAHYPLKCAGGWRGRRYRKD